MDAKLGAVFSELAYDNTSVYGDRPQLFLQCQSSE